MIPARKRIRELWLLVQTLRREGVSWRRMPQVMHERYGVPLVAHVSYIAVARERGDVLHKPRDRKSRSTPN